MGFSFSHLLIVVVVVLIIFGAGKLPNVMGDLGKGIRNFKAGLDDGSKKPDQAQLPPSDKDSA